MPGSRNSGGHDRHDVSPRFVHISDGEGECLELPSHYFERPNFVFWLASLIPGFFSFYELEPLWMPTIERALDEHWSGDSTALARLLHEAPSMIEEVDDVCRALADDIASGKYVLFRTVLDSVPHKVLEDGTIELFVRVEAFRRSDGSAALGNRTFVLTALDGLRDGDGNANNEGRVNDVALANTGGGETGFLGRKGEFARVRQAYNRAKKKGAVIVPIAVVRCTEHASTQNRHDVHKPLGPWNDSIRPTIPTLDQLVAAKVLVPEAF